MRLPQGTQPPSVIQFNCIMLVDFTLEIVESVASDETINFAPSGALRSMNVTTPVLLKQLHFSNLSYQI